jgi:hypothetical protein
LHSPEADRLVREVTRYWNHESLPAQKFVSHVALYAAEKAEQ